MSSKFIRSTLALIILVVITATIGSVPVSGHTEDWSEAYRVFFADDTDPYASQDPILSDFDLKRISGTEKEISDLSKELDFFYQSTEPTIVFSDRERSLIEYQRNRLSEVQHSRTTSRWYGSENKPVGGKYIKDATISIVDVAGGAVLHLPGHDADGQYLIPDKGSVFTHSDFRIDESELPADYCTDIEWEYRTERYTIAVVNIDENGTRTIDTQERSRKVKTDGDQWCFHHKLLRPSLNRTLQFGVRFPGSWQDTPAGVSELPYSNLRLPGPDRLITAASISVIERTIRRHHDWDPGVGWHLEQEMNRNERFTTQVGDSRLVHVTTNRDLTVRQRIIQRGINRVGIVLSFDGPPSIGERRLWSRAVFNNQQDLLNIWGIYSRTGSHHGFLSSNLDRNQEPFAFPPIPVLHVTAVRATVTPRFVSNGTVGYFEHPGVIPSEPHLITNNRYEPGASVNLSTAPSNRFDVVMLRNPPESVKSVLDIHDDPIPLETTISSLRQSVIRIQSTNESRLEIRLVDAETGRGLAGRTIHLSGTTESTEQTNAAGGISVRPTRRYVTVEFRGDEWQEPQSVYYEEASETIRVGPPKGSLIEPIRDIIGQWRILGFWVVLAFVGWLWFEGRPS